MIPWFFVNLIGFLAWPLGYQIYVRATGNSWRWGADRIHFFARDSNGIRPTTLRPYRGGPVGLSERIEGVESDLGPSGPKSQYG